jgi:pyruvate dehydrogenase E2 component (dihydrolipoamide acetyltransferase)
MESPAAGVVRGIRAGEGDEVKVGETICWIAAPGETIANRANIGGVTAPAGGSTVKLDHPADAAATAPPSGVQSPLQGGIQVAQDAVRATPLARKVAKELGVDLAQITGSGPNGIIRDGDVREAVTRDKQAVPVESTKSGADGQEEKWVALTRIQAVTARRMLESVREIPQFSLSADADATNLLWLQEALAERVRARSGARLTLTVLLVKIAAETLKQHPRVNASYQEDAGGRPGLRLHSLVNCGVAVGAEEGLAVPVIHDAGNRSIEEVAAGLQGFAEQATTMRFSPSDLEGGTFTISNLGMFGVERFNAILNPPQSAILAVGKVTRRMVEALAGGGELRPILTLTLTVDHRVLDGAQAARFLADLRERVEKPYFLL